VIVGAADAVSAKLTITGSHGEDATFDTLSVTM